MSPSTETAAPPPLAPARQAASTAAENHLASPSSSPGRLFEPVLWQLAWREQRLLLAALSAMLFVFAIVYVWIMEMVKEDNFAKLLLGAFSAFEKISGVPFSDLATPQGKIGVLFVDPVVLLVMTVWAVSRGSDFVSGELDRGTMEMLLAQPIRRLSLFCSKMGMTVLGVLVLAIALWLGVTAGIAVIQGQFAGLNGAQFWPGVLNVFCLGFMISGVAAMVSAPDRYRWRTVGIMGSCYATWLLLKIIYKMAGEDTKWVGWFTPFVAFEPQHLIKYAGNLRDQLVYNGSLLGLGIVCYAAAATIFTKRDLPAPL